LKAKTSNPILVCFAVAQEARPFARRRRENSDLSVIQTGMGLRNAEHAIREALTQTTPRLVVTSGFAGGLNPTFSRETIVFDCPPDLPLFALLINAGALPATFVSINRVLAFAADKTKLRDQTRADVVDMESARIREICANAGIPSATVRVISDTAQEDLPLDFNALMTGQVRLSGLRLAAALLRSPDRLLRLMRFGLRTKSAAIRLANTLHQVLPDPGSPLDTSPS
jgi:adenosylhomocysteine nucleosidase